MQHGVYEYEHFPTLYMTGLFSIQYERHDPAGRVKIADIQSRCPRFIHLQEGDILIAVDDFICQGKTFDAILAEIRRTARRNRIIRVDRLETMSSTVSRAAGQPPRAPPSPLALARGAFNRIRGGRGRGRDGGNGGHGRGGSIRVAFRPESVVALRAALTERMESQRFRVQKIGKTPRKFSDVHGPSAYDKKEQMYKAFHEWSTMTDFREIGGSNEMPGVYMALIEIEPYRPTNPRGGPQGKPKSNMLQKPKVVMSSRNLEGVAEVASKLCAMAAAEWRPENINDFDLVYAYDAKTALRATAGDRQKSNNKCSGSASAPVELEIEDEIAAAQQQDGDNEEHDNNNVPQY